MLEFTTGRCYSSEHDHIIRAVAVKIPTKSGELEPCVIFEDEVRQIAGVILWGDFTKEAIMDDYDKGFYRDATTAEVSLIR